MAKRRLIYKNTEHVLFPINAEVKELGKRKEPKLIIGKKYYVSFGNNIAWACILDEIYIDEFTKNKRLKISFYNKNGIRQAVNDVSLISIGSTPLEAIQNEVIMD